MSSEQKVLRPGLELALVGGAFFAIWFVWGSTYLAGRIAVETIPPVLLAAARSLVAGAILLPLARHFETGPRPAWGPAALTGTLLFAGGHGLLCIALRMVPSGPAALVEATIPLWLILFAWLMERRGWRSRRELVGTAIGFGGIVLLVAPWRLSAGESMPLAGFLLLVASAVAWAGGSIGARRAGLLRTPFQASGMQLLSGGAVALAISAVSGEAAGFDPRQLAPAALWAFVYLVLGGSLLAFASYNWLLGRISTAKVASYAYVNPVVALLLGWWLAAELLSPGIVLAAAVTLGGVALVVTSRPVADNNLKGGRE